MKQYEAYDIDGTKLERGCLVQIVHGNDSHNWLKKGNKLRVSHWEDRSFGSKPHIIVFLESKKGGKVCRLGLHEKCLRKVVG